MSKMILLTGGSGFLGSFVLEKLLQKNYRVFVPRSKQFDLTVRSEVNKVFDIVRPDIVVHLAAKVGGIGANRENPGRFFYDNISMGINLVDASREYGVDKFVHIGTVCSYPKYCPVPFREDDLWSGFPEETNAPYGIAKKSIITMLEGYKAQYGLNSNVLLPVNLYGPKDNFKEESSHVIPALIKRVYDAKVRGEREVVCWGTGSASREFLYVKDAADGICAAVDSYLKDPVPINLGGGGEITIKRLMQLICENMGYDGKIVWDTSKPDGQPRRCLDVSRCKELLSWEPKTDFVTGIRETISWYKHSR
jgi:nucleoside-diphosphate-sugar epimerase